LRTAAESQALAANTIPDGPSKAALIKQIDTWQKTVARYEDEAEPPEGRKQLMARAQEAEHRRDTALARYHHYEIASAAYQIAIVLASATIITGAAVLTWICIGLGLAGLAFTAIGLFAPHAVHLF
jgi:hypothetical protein